MVRRRKDPEPSLPEVDVGTGVRLLEAQIQKGKELLDSRPLDSDRYGKWELLTRNYLEKAFGRNSPNVSSVTDVGRYGSFPINAGEDWWESNRAGNLATKISRLDGLVELLRTELQLQQQSDVDGARPATKTGGHRIFLVHGHNEAATSEVARFLERLAQDVTILREQPNQGRTIIEKFEDHSDVGFAVVLLTGDDQCRTGAAKGGDWQVRARQNVILELGFFLGRLGRARVCALYADGVEIPSDYSGVLFVPLDENGGWRLTLARELRAAKFEIDMNMAM